MVRVASHTRIESILLSMVDWAWAKDVWFCARECCPWVSQRITSSRCFVDACRVLCLGIPTTLRVGQTNLVKQATILQKNN